MITDIVKNKRLFIIICVFLATVIVLLSIWKQQVPIVEGMVIMDFTTPSDPNAGSKITDMDLQGYNSALIPFEKKFETAEKAVSTIDNYIKSYDYKTDEKKGEINMEGISTTGLDGFIEHLKKTSDAFKIFADTLSKMKKDKMDAALQEKQGLSGLSVISA